MTDPTSTAPMDTTLTDRAPRALRRCPHHRMLAGVAAGVADFLEVDVTAVRIAFVVLALIGGVAIPLYVAAWLLVPDEESGTSIVGELLAPRGQY